MKTLGYGKNADENKTSVARRTCQRLREGLLEGIERVKYRGVDRNGIRDSLSVYRTYDDEKATVWQMKCSPRLVLFVAKLLRDKDDLVRINAARSLRDAKEQGVDLSPARRAMAKGYVSAKNAVINEVNVSYAVAETENILAGILGLMSLAELKELKNDMLREYSRYPPAAA